MSSVVASPVMATISTGFRTSQFNKICTAKCYIQSPLHPVLYRHKYSIKFPSPFTLITRVSRTNRVANSTRGENSFEDTEEPVIKAGASSDETKISPAMFHFLNATLRWVYFMIVIGTLGRKNNPQVTWAAMGIIASAYMSKALKVLLNQGRPSSAFGIRADPGMPSSHAYTLLYLAVYSAVALIGWKGLDTITFGIGFTIIVLGAFMAWLRTVEGVHTNFQVLVGIVLGSVTAILWYYTWNTVMIKYLYFFDKVRVFLHLSTLIALLNL